MDKQTPELFERQLKVVNLGLGSFYDALRAQGVESINIDWRPPAGGDPVLAEALSRLETPDIDRANQEGIRRLRESLPVLLDVKPAAEVIPGMETTTILHAGPPISWERMCGPVKGAIMGALIYEGLAEDLAGAEKLAASGTIKFEPCHHHQAVGPMAGVLSSSMYVWCVKNETFGNYGYCSLNEGLGKVLRFGAHDPEVIQRLQWMQQVLGPALSRAVRLSGGINLKNLTAKALLMGDECHNRNVAASLLFLQEIMPYLLQSGLDSATLEKVHRFISGNVHFFLNLSMAACKATADTILGLEHSTLLSDMARNGTENGIRVAGLGNRWFTAPAGNPKGLYFPGYSATDANPDLGDSTISEVAGIGGFAMAAAPAIVRFIGGTPADAVKYTKEMYEICADRHRDYQIPFLDFAGTPLGVDIRKVVATGITPIINTGIAHRQAGIGQVGAGILYAPKEGFIQALQAFTEQMAVKA